MTDTRGPSGRDRTGGPPAVWERAARHLHGLGPGPVLDVGCGTGDWADALARWSGRPVVGVDPAPAAPARAGRADAVLVAGLAQALPLAPGAAAAAWLSRVLHHVDDLAAPATELRRVLAPGAPVLVREAFPEFAHTRAYARFFPEGVRAAHGRPTLAHTLAVFADAGFTPRETVPVEEPFADSCTALAARIRRDGDGMLRCLSDAEFARGTERLRAAAGRERRTGVYEPVTDRIDLLVLA
ncbi:class I SAM-dependent methyltransferase [Nocardiopsis sp. NPDC101807]|uniref:class I SAM-dependent methyltransferase n=1 Tax=Nocardiopsis sp. NPDC101807 TaxID=3364339 RepID=UPI00380D1F5D